MADSPKAVFLSYAREDTDAARRIADALRSQGLEVWFDQNELRGGDAWDAKIRRQINDCALFLPIISQHTQERGKGYFRLEWKLAVEQTHLMAEGMAFLAPVVVDDTPEGGSLVPPEFMRVQWTRLPGALPTPQFVEQVKRLLAAPAKSAPASASPRDTRSPGSTQPGRRLPVAAWGAIAAVVVIGLGLFWWRQSRPEPAATPVPVAAPPASVVPAAPATADKSIAVLPFANMSEEKDSAFFTDGIHEDILTNLALVRELRVVSRTSVMQYRDTKKPIRQVAAELGVTYILEGSVRRSGNKVRVTGQLIHAATDEHVWAKSYDRDLTDVFAIQAELSQQIASALQAALSPQEKQLLERRPTENLAAYDAYVKARQVRQLLGGLTDAEPLLQAAVALDPRFAQAWAELASLQAQIYFSDVDRSAERLAKAKAAIDTAVRLAPDAPEVIEKLGDYYYYGYRDYSRAAEQYQRLAVLRPNDGVVFGSLGLIHRRQGRWGDALAELRRSVQLEPRNLRYSRTLMQLLLGLRRFEEALAIQHEIVAQDPRQLPELAQQTIIPLLARGSTREGDTLLAEFKPEAKDVQLLLFWRMAWARLVDDFDTAVRLDQQQRYFDFFSEPHWSQDSNAAMILLAHGDVEAARARARPAEPEGRAELARRPSATYWVQLAFLHVALGNKPEALRCAQAARELAPEATDAVAGPQVSVSCAQVLAWCGETDRALAELTRLLHTPFGENIHAARIHPLWKPLRNDPRFEALVNDPKNNQPLF